MEIMKYIGDVNILLVVLDILFLVVSFLFFDKKNYGTKVKDIFVICYTLVNLFLFTYFNSVFKVVFTLKFLSVRVYLILILFTLFVFWYTFNKKIKLSYKICNYFYSFFIIAIALFNIYIVLSDRVEIYNFFDINYSIVLMNVSYIGFFCYLLLLLLVYIGYYLYDRYSKVKVSKVLDTIDSVVAEEEIRSNNIVNNVDDSNKNKIDELFNYKVGDKFYIKGIDCSIIFCDSNKENIIKNYEILSSDINAKMVNGFTLDENIMIKDICSKLNVSNLGGINIDNVGLLNVISVEEYSFLKRIM